MFCDDADISWSSSDNEETDTKMTLNQPVEISDISSLFFFVYFFKRYVYSISVVKNVL